jgi:hypothetical protein
MLLLVPSDPLHPRRPDAHFAAEAQTAAELSSDVAVVDHDAVVAGRLDEAIREVRGSGTAVYRGWMFRGAEYHALYAALADRGVVLGTTPQMYRSAHELPGWYGVFIELTPRSLWTERVDVVEACELLSLLRPGPAVVKDFVKSMKHYWIEAAFIPDVGERVAAERVIRRFVELRGTDIEGGIVLREFEDFLQPELRTWWYRDKCILVTPHPDSPDALVPTNIGLEDIAAAVARLGSLFVVVDIALTRKGRWRVIEVGDGQVSDRPETTRPEALLRSLL